MALSKIQAESMNLADTYAFTGTISGTSDLVLIDTQTVSSSVASVTHQDKITSTYTLYKCVFNGVKKDTSSGLGLRFMAGSSEISTANYDYVYGMGARSRSDTTWFTRSSDNSYMQLIESVHGNTCSAVYYVDVALKDTNHSTVYGSSSHWTATGAITTTFQARYTLSNSNISGLKYITTSGNYTSGTFSIYGVKR